MSLTDDDNNNNDNRDDENDDHDSNEVWDEVTESKLHFLTFS